MVDHRQVAGYLNHLFEREHHLHNRAKFYALCRIITVQGFVGAVHPLRLAVEAAYICKTLPHSIDIFLFRMMLIIYHRFFDALS